MSARILVLGAGAIGRAAATFARESDYVGDIVIADRNLEAAEQIASSIGASAVRVDVTDAGQLADAMRRVDVVLNCVGPYYRFGPPVLAAAIAAGRTYLDVCDDWEPTLAALDMDATARSAGVTAIIGQGASPGTANLVGKYCANAVDACHTLLTAWSLEDEPGDPESAANEHWLMQSTGLIRVWRNGGYVDEPSLQEVSVELPGFPPRTALTVGHPEAVTLPRAIPTLRTCLNLMTLPPSLVATLRRAAEAVAAGMPLKDASRTILAAHRPGALPPAPDYPGLWAIAEGKTRRAAAYLPDYGRMTDLGTVTAAPMVAGLNLVLEGKVARIGVLTPEEAFAPEDYFSALAKVAGVKPPVVRLIVE